MATQQGFFRYWFSHKTHIFGSSCSFSDLISDTWKFRHPCSHIQHSWVPHTSCSKSPKSMPELEIKCYGGIPPVVLSLKSCCLCYKNLSHTVTPVKRLSRTAATHRRAKTSTGTFSRSLILLQLNFLRMVSLKSILAWADLVLLCKVQIAISGQDLRKKDSLLYLCFCHHGCAHSGRLWRIKNHCPMDVTLYYNERPLPASVEKHPCNWCG